MKLLIDECVPRKVKFLFPEVGLECETVGDAGFNGKENGELLALAEPHFDVLVTIDKNISIPAEHDETKPSYPGHPRSFERSR